MTRAVAVLLAFGFTMSSGVAAPPRVRYTINEQWQYAPNRDSTAISVNLPHTWNASDAFDEELGYRRGEGWYRKSLRVDPALRGSSGSFSTSKE